MADAERRRRRSRHGPETGSPNTGSAPGDDNGFPSPGRTDPPGARSADDGGPVAGDDRSASTAGTHDPEPADRRRTGPAADDRDGERGLRGLVGPGSSQVTVGTALRARDAARPTDRHLAEAEANLTVVRRNWVPREDLPRPGR